MCMDFVVLSEVVFKSIFKEIEYFYGFNYVKI